MTIRYLVAGRVQGVGFRVFVRRRACELGLRGWVMNLPDGRVEVVSSGGPDAQSSMERSLWSGPPHSRVVEVGKIEISDELAVSNTFEIKQ